jgi:hypothetical protein
VELGDDVAVYIPKRGVTVRSRIVKTVYDGKKGRFSSVTVGDIETDITDTMAGMAKATANIEARTVAGEKAVAKVIAETTAMGAKVGLIVETTADGTNKVRGGVLVEAINGQTAAKISADVVNIDVVKTLNAKADEINLVSDLLKISSSGFSLENGALYATEGEIAGWVMTKDDEFKGDPVLRTKDGIYGTISYNAGVYVEKTGYIFIVQTSVGTYYIVKESPIYESTTLAKVSALRSVGLSNLTFYYEDSNSGGGIA